MLLMLSAAAARIMIILIILMRHFMSHNGIEIEWLVTASSLWRRDNGPRWKQDIHDGPPEQGNLNY